MTDIFAPGWATIQRQICSHYWVMDSDPSALKVAICQRIQRQRPLDLSVDSTKPRCSHCRSMFGRGWFALHGERYSVGEGVAVRRIDNGPLPAPPFTL